MSAEGQGDLPSLDKEEEASATAIQPGIPKNSSETKAGISSLSKSDTQKSQNTLTFMGEELEPFDDDVEAVIEKKLSPLERDKGLDVDSELDFELKWDDDSDNANDNQSAAKIDAKIDEKLEIDGAKGDDPSKATTNTLVGKVADETPNMKQKTSEQENIDKPEFIDQLDYLIGEVSEASSKESENQVALEESEVIHTAPNVEKDVFTMETNAKIGLEGKISSEASENSSLDERLVYSDVEVPEIEDKELMDELDAQICGSDPNEEEKDIEDETVSVKAVFVPESGPKESEDAGSSQQITDSAMDVDDVAKLDSPNDKLDPSDTLSSSIDLETSSYEINKEHKLAKPDVMLEIPTQELIESFDDSDMSDVALEYDEDVLLNNDATNDIVLIEDQKLPANNKIVDDIANSNANNKDERETHTGITEQPDVLQMESIAIETETSKILDKLVLESDSENENSKTTEIKESEANEIELMDIDDEKEESHADIILEAHLEPNVIETEVASQLADEPTAIVEMDIQMPVTLAPEADTDTIEISSSGEIEPIMSIDNTDIKKVISVVGMETNVDKVSNAVEMGPEVLVDVKETDTATDLESKMVTEAIEVNSTSHVVAKETTIAKEGLSTEDEMVEKTIKAVSTSQVVPPEVTAKDVISTADLAEKLVAETLEVTPKGTNDAIDAISTANVAGNETLDTMEVISTSEVVPEEITATKEVISTIDAPSKVDTKDKIDSPALENLEEVTAAKEVVSVADDSAKEVSDVKSDIPAETNLEEVSLAKEVILTADEPAKVVTEAKSSAETVPEVSKEVNVASSHIKEGKEASLVDQAQPSSSKYMQDSSDEDQELTDSLGLLAESVRVMDDDDEPELEDDEDDDFDQDDESNQMTAEHSEDSNAQHSETEVAKEAMEAEEAMEVEEAADDKGIPFQIAEVISASDIEVLAETEVPEIIVEGMEVAEDTEVEKAVQSLLEVEEGKIIEEAVTTVAEVVEPVADDTVKSDDTVEDNEAEEESSKLRQLLIKSKDGAKTVEGEKTSPSKTKKLEIAKPKNEINIVELEESSSEDDIQEVPKLSTPPPDAAPDVTTVNIPDGVEVMSAAAGHTSAMRRGAGELVISGVPRPPPNKPARLNTGEVTIKTAATTTEPLVIPEAKTATAKKPQDAKQPKLGLEIFSLDSDDDEKESAAPKQLTAVEIDKARATGRCINAQCRSGPGADTSPAGAAFVAHYGGRRGAVCRPCAAAVTSRGRSLIEGIKALEPLLSLDMGQTREELVEISDSDSEEEASAAKTTEEAIGEKEADFLEDQLASMFNKTWKKYNMDERLKAAESEINIEVLKLEEECSKINAMLNECQVATDKLRNDLYDTFSGETNELPAILIYDTPPSTWSGLEENIQAFEAKETRQSKRRSSIPEPPAKRAAIPLGYTPLDSDANTAPNEPKAATSSTDVVMQNDDDNSDVSVVKLSAEAAPADLPGPGTASRPPLVPQMTVYAMRNAFGSWSRARIMDVQPKVKGQFTMCRVKFEHKVKNPTKVLQARCLAYEHPSDVRMTIGTRLIALFKDNDNKRESHYSGIVAEIPNPVNNYRYLVFFDDGYAQYVQHSATRLVCESAPLVWDEVHPFSRQFVREYLRSYPERPMVRVHAGQSVRTEYNGKWWDSKVLQVDASLVQVHFDKENRTEWIYRGSTRLAPLYWELQAAERQRARPLPRAQPGKRFNMPYVEYTRSDDPAPPTAPSPAQIEQDIRRQRAVAKKSTAAPPPPPPAPLDGVASRVVFYTPKNAIRPHKMTPHTCGPRCRRTDVLALKDLRTYNPLTKPLLSGWERQIVKFKWSRSVMYRAPCGRRLRNYQELHRYLQTTCSDMAVDLFDFGPNTHCLAEFVLTKCRISKKDLSHGKENVPVPCVNYYDDSLPEFCSYNTERTPTAGVPLNLDPEFLCGCDCTDDCADKSKCACWKMTLEGARTIGLDTDEVGYVYKRLPEPLPSGIYECNARCKCRQTCLNRVAQHPLQLKLQVFKTLNRGWGIRALNDIPKGAFLCVYAGNLLTDATANLDGLNEGDEYLAELDYIEVVEQMKEGFESDIPDADKKLDKESGDQDDSSTTASSSDEEEDPRKNADDDDFRPALPLAHAPTEFSKRLRKREKKKKDEKEDKQKEKDPNAEDNCITISDDEELREPARFAAQAGMGEKGFISKHKSVRAHFGKDEACYIMDAKVQGNIGRYLNHSCTPNVFVQNVFVDTHDPRFPWVAFFALSHIRAGTELTWNYNYDVGSVPGKVLYCHCAAPNCRGRLL